MDSASAARERRGYVSTVGWQAGHLERGFCGRRSTDDGVVVGGGSGLGCLLWTGGEIVGIGRDAVYEQSAAKHFCEWNFVVVAQNFNFEHQVGTEARQIMNLAEETDDRGGPRVRQFVHLRAGHSFHNLAHKR